MKIGEKIRIKRLEKGMTQEELANAIGLSSKQIIYHYESGFRNPSLEVLEKISDVFNCELFIEFKEK